MSVIVVARFKVPDVAKAVESFSSNAALMEEVSEDAKPQGALHHRFLAGDGELLVVDEWETAEGFQKFFEGNEKIAKVTAEAGVTGPPDVSVFSPVEAPGTF